VQYKNEQIDSQFDSESQLMGSTRQPAHESATRNLGARIRAECVRRGLELQELAEQAGVSRTTLYHLERGHTGRVRTRTLQKIAGALGLTVEDLFSPLRSIPLAASTFDREKSRSFDRATNPLVTEVMQEQPHLFAGWSESDVDELYSTFGTGGPLSARGVINAAEAINRKRDAIHKLHVVLETHLREHALGMIDMMYQMVQPKPPSASAHPPQEPPP
jgi:transcriptional regulator with XRE-family HTH domain